MWIIESSMKINNLRLNLILKKPSYVLFLQNEKQKSVCEQLVNSVVNPLRKVSQLNIYVSEVKWEQQYVAI